MTRKPEGKLVLTGLPGWANAQIGGRPGRWLCNLGWHVARKRGSLSGMVRQYEGGRVGLHYLRCHRCGDYFPGNVTVRVPETFPSGREGDDPVIYSAFMEGH